MLPVLVAIGLGAVLGAVMVTRPEGAAAPVASTAVIDTGVLDPSVGNPDGTPFAPNPVPVTALGDLGTVSTPRALRAAVRAAQARGVPDGATPPPCAQVALPTVGLIVAGGAGSGQADGQPVTVLVGTRADGQEAAVVVRDAGCSLLLQTTIPPS